MRSGSFTGRALAVTSTPPLLRRRSSDEYSPLPETSNDRRIAVLLDQSTERLAPAVGLDPADYVVDRRGTAATLRAIDDANGGGFYDLPEEALSEEAAAAAVFGGREPVVDGQTHLVNPGRWRPENSAALSAFLQACDPQRWPDRVDPIRIDAAAWASLVFGASETAVALLTSTPGLPEDNVLTNSEIAATRDLVDRYAGTGRVLTHAIVHPNESDTELERMQTWARELRPTAWKVYTMAGPGTDSTPDGGWFLDDTGLGFRFLDAVRDSGIHIVAAHKGISGAIHDQILSGATPRDIGPAAVAYPDLTFVVFHSGYEPDPDGQEGAHDPVEPRGTSRLVASLAAAGIGAGQNVYAELGSTWYLMLRRPTEAAHVLGKLLLAVGSERIVWGTDSIWYGSPQPQIDAFRAFTIPERVQAEFGYPELTVAMKEQILSLNARQLYGVADDTVYGVDMDRDREWSANASTTLRQMLRQSASS